MDHAFNVLSRIVKPVQAQAVSHSNHLLDRLQLLLLIKFSQQYVIQVAQYVQPLIHHHVLHA
jgi:hypothetical protein